MSKEIQLLIKLMHPFVIGLYDLYTEGESGKAQTMNLVMTYCDGGDLSKLIKVRWGLGDGGGEGRGHVIFFSSSSNLNLSSRRRNERIWTAWTLSNTRTRSCIPPRISSAGSA